MLNKEEFVLLYEKYQAGLCSPAEIELLNNYRDELSLLDSNWNKSNPEDEQTVHDRIRQRLDKNRGYVYESKTGNYKWLKVAAILLITLSVGIGFIKYNSSSKQTNILKVAQKRPSSSINPGGNKAFLTVADGSTIALTDAKNGQLTTQAGVPINKTKDGVLVYHAANKLNANTHYAINTITTPRGGQYMVVLADGTKVWLNSVSSLKYPVTFNGNTRTVELTGEGYFEVAKNKEKPFIVNANGTSVKVLGTHFNISAYSDDKTVTTTLLEGSVKLSKADKEAMLVPGQQGISVNGNSAINVQNADTEQAVAWKNGFFLFRDTDIKDIMKQAARWYDVDIDYAGNLNNKKYGGKISKYKDISELMNNLELTGTIHYKIDGRRVTVMQ
ncbi:FecR family protein [Mucilaginibacter segetis]|uniref:DUF4974 domain-containing protein n=1 Tax=Mucilaginibacter segetis TaxID=2793071 RepID=A0A934UN61_9SPHI|nr:FecR family protein [Mucilaginibacter segetis]MBK0379720.1 DUF4974 domain-containing protein [Mucilaginibacter segetis]